MNRRIQFSIDTIIHLAGERVSHGGGRACGMSRECSFIINNSNCAVQVLTDVCKLSFLWLVSHQVWKMTPPPLLTPTQITTLLLLPPLPKWLCAKCSYSFFIAINWMWKRVFCSVIYQEWQFLLAQENTYEFLTDITRAPDPAWKGLSNTCTWLWHRKVCFWIQYEHLYIDKSGVMQQRQTLINRSSLKILF